MLKKRYNTRQPAGRNVQKALGYISDIELFFNETDTAVPLLVEVFKTADTDLKDEIIFLLGTVARLKVCGWLHKGKHASRCGPSAKRHRGAFG